MAEHRRILVIGGEGRLGSALSKAGCRALGRKACDITQPDMIRDALTAYTPDLVINCAAYTDVDRAETEPDLAYAVNHDGAAYLASACAASRTPLIHISTDYVFGDGLSNRPVTEDDAPAPLSVYGTSKWLGDEAVRKSSDCSIVVRVSWLFDQSRSSFIGKMLALAHTQDRLSIAQDSYGRPTPIADLVHPLIKLGYRMIDGMPVPGIIHIGPQEPVSRYEWATAIFEDSARFGGPAPRLIPCADEHAPEPARRPRNLILDIATGNALLGLMPDWRAASTRVVETLLAKEMA